MAVTKQTYTIPSSGQSWTGADLANAFRSAFIDAGYMADWFDSFTTGGDIKRVLEVTYNAAKTYGKLYYVFSFNSSGLNPPSVAIATGWNASTDTPTGTQYLDYEVLPTAWNASTTTGTSTPIIGVTLSQSTPCELHRYTSQVNSNQSWFVLQQNTSVSSPFTILSGSTNLLPWLDLDKGIVPGLMTVSTANTSLTGTITFAQEENLRRALGIGSILYGNTNTSSGFIWHSISHDHYRYTGLGLSSNDTVSNGSSVVSGSAPFIIPVGNSLSNPAYSSNYIPICTGLPWCQYTTSLLASDFAVYCHYANNTMFFEDRFVVSAGVEEWEILTVTNNPTLNFGASPCFLARVV